MQVPTIDAATIRPVPTGAGVTARVVSGNLAQVPVGALLEATVTSVSPREIALAVNGLPLTVRPPVGLPPFQPGTALLVRVPTTASATNPTLELAVSANPMSGPNQTARSGAPGAETAPGSTRPALSTVPPFPSRVAVVDVLALLPDGRVRVQLDGVEQVATAAEPLATGGRYVFQVERNPAGIKLSSPADTPALPTEVAAAILRTPAPTLSASLEPLRAELAALAAAPTGGKGETAHPAAGAVREAARAVENTLRTILPNDPRPPDAAQLRQLVEDGGLHYEAKLARLVEEPNALGGQAPTARDIGPDLKGDLLRLLQAVNDLGGAARAPAVEAAVRGIESQQAANALAQANNAPYFLQVPFPDGSDWRTLHLSLEPQHLPDRPDAERAGRFRVFMHVPLTDLGETWIDAGLSGDQFRATIYLDRSTVRDRVRAALPDLRAELRGDGFVEVLLDVRSSSELPERHRREAGAMQAGRPETVSVLDVRA